MLLIFFDNVKLFFNKITMISSGVFGIPDYRMLLYTSFLIVYPIIYIFQYECQPNEQKKDKKQACKGKDSKAKESTAIEDSGKVNNQLRLQQGQRSNNENLEFIQQYMSRKILQNSHSGKTSRQVRVIIGDEQSIYIRGEFEGDVKQHLFKTRSFQSHLKRFSGSLPKNLRIMNRSKESEIASTGRTDSKTELAKIEEVTDQTKIDEWQQKKNDYSKSKGSKPRITIELDLGKYPYMNRDYSAALIYIKNVVIYGMIILGNRSSQQNLFIVLQIQLALTIWLGISKPKHLKLKWSWLLQELYFNIYIITLIIFFIDPNENRQNWMVLSYFIGFSVSVFLFVYYLSWEIIYLPLKQFIMLQHMGIRTDSQTLTPSDH